VRTELFLATLEQRLHGRLRLVLLLGVNGVASFLMAGPLPLGAFAPFLTAILVTSGVLGKEFSSGTPQLTFARPVRRSEYVLMRYLACVSLTLVVNLVPFVLATLFKPWGLHPLPDLLLLAVVSPFATRAVITGLSAASGGFADVALLLGLGLVPLVLNRVADTLRAPALGHAVALLADGVLRFLYPTLTVNGLVDLRVTATTVAAFVAVTLTWLVVAIALVNRREITYATD